jgi:hypothetical protein
MHISSLGRRSSIEEYLASRGVKTMIRSPLIIRSGSRERISGLLVKFPGSVEVWALSVVQVYSLMKQAKGRGVKRRGV